MRIAGSAMREAGIDDGDLALVDRAMEAEPWADRDRQHKETSFFVAGCNAQATIFAWWPRIQTGIETPGFGR